MAFGIPAFSPGLQSPEKYSYLVTQADGTWKETEITEERPSLMEYDYRKITGRGPDASGPGGFRGGFPGGGFR